jgi:hypothetical protein
MSVGIAASMLADLAAFARDWRPDLIVYEPTTYAAPLVGEMLGIPYVRVLWGIDFHAPARHVEEEAFRELAASVGAGDFAPRGVLTVDPCPPRLQVDDGVAARQLMRYVPYNGPGVLPRDLAPSGALPRVCVSWGLSGAWAANRLGYDSDVSLMRRVVSAAAALDVEVVAALSPRDGAALGPVPANVRTVTGAPLHQLLPGCDLLVNRGGAGTLMTGLMAGIPQLCVPQHSSDALCGRRLASVGAGFFLPPDEATTDCLQEAAAEAMTDGPRAAAAGLRADALAHPSPVQVAGVLEDLVADGGGR